MRWLIFLSFILSFAVSASDFCQKLDKKSLSQGARFDNSQNIYSVGGKGRLQFYSAPDKACSINHVFVIPGDELIAYYEYHNFYRVMYLANGNDGVTGWVEKERLIETHKGIAPDDKVQRLESDNKGIGPEDFSLILNNERFSPGDRWNDEAQKRAGVQGGQHFIGEMPFGADFYKYYQHNYNGFEIYTSNLFWQKEHRDVDSYIIFQITVHASNITTFRGVSIGDTRYDLVEKYGHGVEDNSDGQHWIYYEGDGKRLSFQIENDKVSSIMLVLYPDKTGI